MPLFNGHITDVFFTAVLNVSESDHTLHSLIKYVHYMYFSSENKISI